MRDPFQEVNLMDLEEKFIHKEIIIKVDLLISFYKGEFEYGKISNQGLVVIGKEKNDTKE